MSSHAMTLRRALGAVWLVATTAAALPALAQDWPDRASRFIVPFPAGGVLDVLTRAVAEPLQAASGKTVVVENTAGGSGNIAIQQVARAAADGSVVLFVPQGNITINATLMPDLLFKWDRDFRPVTLLAYTPNVLVVHPSVPAKTVAELIAYARSKPGQLNYASPGNGSSLHLIGELFKREAKVDLLHVPYKGTTQAMQDLVGGQVQVMFGALPTLMPMVKSGKLRALAVTTARRADTAPDLPTLAEAGVAGIDVPSWYGVMLPAAATPELASRVQGALAAAMARPEVRERLVSQGYVPVANKPDEFGAQIRRETAVWAGVIRDAKVKAD